ncbi:MAG: hypothetical protein DDT38_00092 [Firmicutes bacterium]|nr:hypothetical protein [candidate division NPL-UPA2 bacterium]
MLSQTKLDRLSALAQIRKDRQLTPAELTEQKVLREEYMQSFRTRVATQLESMGMRPRQSQECDCGCVHKHPAHGRDRG